MDIAEILKNVPVGTKLYSPLCGEVVFEGVVDHKDGKGQSVSEIKVRKNNMFFAFNSDGRYLEFSDVEVLLFPSRTNRNWVEFYYHFSPEEGEPVCHKYIGDRFNRELKKWEYDVECEEWNDTFTFHSLKPAKTLIKANPDKYKCSYITKTWANGDWENLGEINIKASNKTFVANTKQVKANY